ncbi:GntR family transcriptional regulator [Umezawaea endophytica]|uniref:UTRA domain-containing protein n=1 Tax=Umezawaea endophytica TaxID=1654476 RepID=A0A9X3AGL2_9PSEU|nr:UTRA domain-containing protein [Umezawaea endophytica]MCS7479776.1 UTRA domain-containing protein [Umezawaea endophytica]
MTSQDRWVSRSTAYVTPGVGDAWAAEAESRGAKAGQRLREVGEVEPSRLVAEALAVAEGQPVVVRRRVMSLDGRPVELTDSYYPVSIARGTRLAEARKIPGGAITLLAELGHAPAHVREEVSARPATAEERELLDLGQDDWVMVLFRLVSTADGTPVEASAMTMIARGTRLGYERDL